jgi:hypothetical protein
MAHIELSEFIHSALVQIAKGVHEANKELKNPEEQQFEVFNLRHNKGEIRGHHTS